MKDTSAEVRQTCEARPMSAASRAAVYVAIRCRIASVAALASSALSPDAGHGRVRASAKHKPKARAPAAVALFGLPIVDLPRAATLSVQRLAQRSSQPAVST